MKRIQIAAVVAGAAVSLAGVGVAASMIRGENRERALKLMRTSAELGVKGSKVAGEWAVIASKFSGQTAKQAAVQYQVKATQAIETLSSLVQRQKAVEKAEQKTAVAVSA